MDLVATCRVPAIPLAARIIEISTTGCLAECDAACEAQAGATVLVQISETDLVPGRIVRRTGHHIAVRFHHPLSGGVIEEKDADTPQSHTISDDLHDHFGRRLPDLVSMSKPCAD